MVSSSPMSYTWLQLDEQNHIIRTGSGNITANNVCLGWFLTDRFRQGHALKEQMAQGMSEAEAINSIAQDIPMGRISKP